MKLFPDQEIVLEEARQKLRELPAILASKGITRKPRILIQAPPGFGKTVISAFIAKSASARQQRSWFICARDFLLTQTALTYSKVGIGYSYMAAKMPMDVHALAHVCMVGSMKSRVDKVGKPKIALWDECHHINAKTWAAQMNALPDSIHIGLTGTPSRLDGQGLDKFFDAMICGPSVEYLISKGRLSNYEYYIPSKPDFSNVHVQAGEYVHAEAVDAMKAVIVGDIVATYRQKADGLRAVYFATSIELSKRYAAAFNAAGILAAHMDKDTPSEERTRIAQAMARGELKVISNVFICAEGYDLAAQAGMDVTVDVVGLCFRTKSLSKLIQCMMRCMRAGARGIIFDHGNNYEEHGFLPDDKIEWSLSGSRRPSDIPPTYLCDGCGSMLKRGVHQCKHCGCDNSAIIRDIKHKAEIAHRQGELERIDRENRIKADAEAKEAEKVKRDIAINSFTTYQQFLSFEKSKGYSKGWALVQWRLRSKGIARRLQAKQRQSLLPL